MLIKCLGGALSHEQLFGQARKRWLERRAQALWVSIDGKKPDSDLMTMIRVSRYWLEPTPTGSPWVHTHGCKSYEFGVPGSALVGATFTLYSIIGGVFSNLS